MNSRALIALLVDDDPRLRHLYHHSAEFHSSMAVIADVLPPLVNLIADSAERHAEARRLASLPSIGPEIAQ